MTPRWRAAGSGALSRVCPTRASSLGRAPTRNPRTCSERGRPRARRSRCPASETERYAAFLQPGAFGGELGEHAPISLALTSGDCAQQLIVKQAGGGQGDFELIGRAEREPEVFEAELGLEASVLVVAA